MGQGRRSRGAHQLAASAAAAIDGTGDIIQSTLDARANGLSQQIVGNVSTLPVIRKTTNAAGQTVEQVKDTSGAIIELTLDSAGKIIGTRVLSQGTTTA